MKEARAFTVLYIFSFSTYFCDHEPILVDDVRLGKLIWNMDTSIKAVLPNQFIVYLNLRSRLTNTKFPVMFLSYILYPM